MPTLNLTVADSDHSQPNRSGTTMQNGFSTVEIDGRKVMEITDFNKSVAIAAPIHVAITAAKLGVEPVTESHPAHPEAKIVSYPIWQSGWKGNMIIKHMTAPDLIQMLRHGRGEDLPTVVAATV